MMALLLLPGCSEDPIRPIDERYKIVDTFKDTPKSVEGVYAIINEPFVKNGLYYADTQAGEFAQIDVFGNDSSQYLIALYLDQEHQLLLASARDYLYFVDTNTNQKIGEIDFGNEWRTLNAEVFNKSISDYGPGSIRIFPYPENSDYLLYANKSVFLINLTTLKIEKVVWNSFAYEQRGSSVITYFPFLSAGSSNLYLSLLLGTGGYDDPEIRLTRLDLNTGNMLTVYDKYNLEDSGINVFSTDDCAISYSFSTNRIFRFSTSTDALIDSFTLSQLGDREFLKSAHSTGNGIIVQGINSSQFYTFNCVQDSLQPLMDLSDEMLGSCSYQILANRDLYALVPYTAAGTHLIVNLSRKSVEWEFRVEHDQKEISVIRMVLKERDN